MVNLVKKKRFHGEIWKLFDEKKLGENLVKPGEIEKLVGNWVKFPKLGEILVEFMNLVKTWWKLGDFF